MIRRILNNTVTPELYVNISVVSRYRFSVKTTIGVVCSVKKNIPHLRLLNGCPPPFGRVLAECNE
ncbi:hypothetical protein SBF1_5740002 [Candidatus Desulfosporosinus infrequens]|uniref:Uncharacterized protein n=1 Tax=Candidatus Desulfosporosinus infrequens TaxID=2043169 RepID=A0A2U3LKN2_9FIRM|nr:hypothetical protein SBF1_5740002 [Candidatus Desulfosporosinus infrequens]